MDSKETKFDLSKVHSLKQLKQYKSTLLDFNKWIHKFHPTIANMKIQVKTFGNYLGIVSTKDTEWIPLLVYSKLILEENNKWQFINSDLVLPSTTEHPLSICMTSFGHYIDHGSFGYLSIRSIITAHYQMETYGVTNVE